MESLKSNPYQAVVIGASSGGLEAFMTILPRFPANFNLPIFITQHLHQKSDSILAELLAEKISMPVKEAEDKEPIKNGVVYISPPGYHLLIEPDKTLSLSIDEFVNYSRPSIDVLFESAAFVFKNSLIGILLTGANEDGGRGLKAIYKNGGLVIVQDPKEALACTMPNAGLKYTHTHNIFRLNQIANFVISKTRY